MDKRLKKLRRKKKEARQKHQRPKLRLDLSTSSNKESQIFREDVLKFIRGTDLTRLFWNQVPREWQRRIITHYNKTDRLHPKDVEFFKNMTADSLEDILIAEIGKHFPKYKNLNYTIRVTCRGPMCYVVYCGALETSSTPHGTVHYLPRVLFPPNKRIALTTHAIERMDTRLFDEAHKRHGCVLRAPTILIPYKNDISTLYGVFPETPQMIFNGYALPYYVLMGYMPIVDRGELIICKTILRPGYDKTPEKNIPEKEISDNRILAIIGGVIHKVKTYKVRRTDVGATCSNTTEPYDLRINPNVKLLLGIKDM